MYVIRVSRCYQGALKVVVSGELADSDAAG